MTVKTVNKRGTNYRNTVIAVVCLIFFSILFSIIFKSFLILFSLLLLYPLTGLMLLYDSFLIKKWQNFLLTLWNDRNLDFSLLKQSLQTMTSLPQNTVLSMYKTLPGQIDLLVWSLGSQKIIKKMVLELISSNQLLTISKSVSSLTIVSCILSGTAAAVILHAIDYFLWTCAAFLLIINYFLIKKNTLLRVYKKIDQLIKTHSIDRNSLNLQLQKLNLDAFPKKGF